MKAGEKKVKLHQMNNYREKLKDKMDEFVKFVYRVTKKFPKTKFTA